jgi:hypothetical protein
MPSPSFRIEPLQGYAPTIGRLVGMLLYARKTTLTAVEGLSVAELDHLHDESSNSIGALLLTLQRWSVGISASRLKSGRPPQRNRRRGSPPSN